MSDELIKPEDAKNEVDMSIIKETDDKLLNELIASESSDELNEVVKKFQLNQAKKNAVRVVNLNDLLDTVNKQAMERFKKRPDEFSNKELIDYMKVTNDLINSSQKNLSGENITDARIQINQQNNEINVGEVGGSKLTEESRQRVIDFVQAALKAANNPQSQVTDETAESDEIIEAEVSEIDNNEDN